VIPIIVSYIRNMNVDFNNLRRQAVISYEKLAKMLNATKASECDYGIFLYGSGRIKKDTIVLDADDIQEIMDDLRMTIGAISACYDEKDDNFKNIFDELFPEGTTMTSFNEPE